MNFVNLLSQVVVVFESSSLEEGRRFPTEGHISKISRWEDSSNGINWYKYQIQGVPEPIEGTIYIVDRDTVAWFKDRTDLVFPARVEHDEYEIHCFGFGRF